MSETAVMEQIEQLRATVARLESRVEDLEDLRDLERAIAENAGRPLVAWEKAKAELGLD
jgi:cell division protein FtsB